MSELNKLKQAQNLTDFAKLLGFTPKGLSYVLYRLDDARKYKVFEIPKAGGGTRTIKAPIAQLALLQSRLHKLLTACVDEILEKDRYFWRASHGFRKRRTIVSNANAHRKRRYLFNVDIKDFFGSINFGRVRGFFIKDRSFELQPAVATLIAQIACHNNSLPQGSPCSPVVSNLVGNILDGRILRLAKRAKCTYTRYADDLTFSTNERLFPLEIANPLAGAEWEPGKQLQEVIERSGFTLNPTKTRMSLRRSRQSVTGLVVNSKVNIQQEYYRRVRAICHSIFNTGAWHRLARSKDAVPEMLTNIRPVEGMLAHIHYVKARQDRSRKINKQNAFNAPKAPVELYRQFLFYKHFVAGTAPMIVTEGVSDIVYLKCAIRALRTKFSALANGTDGSLAVNFLNPTGASRTILGLGEGAGGQSKLVEEYARKLGHYRHLPLLKPTIVLCDNDGGPEKVFKHASSKTGKAISIKTTDPFYFLGHNLYLVKVPEGNPAESRDIEALFPAVWLSKLIDGKPFDKHKDHGDHSAYGKVVFAEKIVRPNMGAIDFSQFEELLDRIMSCIVHFSTRSAAGTLTSLLQSSGTP